MPPSTIGPSNAPEPIGHTPADGGPLQLPVRGMALADPCGMHLAVLLVPHDFSADAHAALRYAIELGRETGACIHLLHSCRVESAWLPRYLAGDADEVRARLRDVAGRKLEKALHEVGAAGLECESHLTELPVVDAIVSTSKQLKVDMIVMGTHGRTGLEHALLGSVAERTVRVAPCPVLTLHAVDPQPLASAPAG